MSSSSLHLKVKKALLVVAMLALYAAIRKGIYEDEDADEEEMGVLLCVVVVVVGIARAGDIQVDADALGYKMAGCPQNQPKCQCLRIQ